MAKITPGNIINQVSGKLAGSVFCANPNTLSIRKNAKHKKSFQKQAIWFAGTLQLNRENAKNTMASISSRWKMLSESTRQQWISATANYQQIDRLGQTIRLTGLALFTKVNIPRLVLGTSITEVAPTPVTYPEVLSNIFGYVDGNLFLNIGLMAVPPSNSTFTFFLTPPMSPGITSPRPSELKFLVRYSMLEDEDYSLTAQYEAVYGSLSQHLGKKIFVEVWSNRTTQSDIPRLAVQQSLIL